RALVTAGGVAGHRDELAPVLQDREKPEGGRAQWRLREAQQLGVPGGGVDAAALDLIAGLEEGVGEEARRPGVEMVIHILARPAALQLRADIIDRGLQHERAAGTEEAADLLQRGTRVAD